MFNSALRKQEKSYTSVAPVLSKPEPTVAEASTDASAISRLYQRHARMVYAVALSRLGPKDAEDVVQEVFLKAMNRLGELRAAAAAGPWLASIARTTSIDAIRKQQRETHAAVASARVAGASDAAVVQDASVRLEACDVLAAIHRLPEAYREPLVLRLVEGLTGPQIAQELGMTHGSVRVNLSKGMDQLRAMLGWTQAQTQARETTL